MKTKEAIAATKTDTPPRTPNIRDNSRNSLVKGGTKNSYQKTNTNKSITSQGKLSTQYTGQYKYLNTYTIAEQPLFDFEFDRGKIFAKYFTQNNLDVVIQNFNTAQRIWDSNTKLRYRKPKYRRQRGKSDKRVDISQFSHQYEDFSHMLF